MKKVLLLLNLVFVYSDAFAMCHYDGATERLGLSLSPKISTDPSIPVGSVLYSKKFGTGHYKTFDCDQRTNDQYIIESTGALAPGVTGLYGKPVYETGIDGIGFQISDILNSKNGSLNPAVVGSTLVPFEKSNDSYRFITVWLIKTKPVIDTTGSSFNPTVNFSAGNLSTNPIANERLFLSTTIKLGNISYKNSSCNISVAGPRQITLNRIDKNSLLAISRGGVTASQKDITMNIDCPTESQGGTITYWFNPKGSASASGNGIIDNMLTGATAAKNVGIIFKLDKTPIVFFDMDNYKITNAKANQSVKFTADYYRASNNSADITSGNVKAILEVVIQEE